MTIRLSAVVPVRLKFFFSTKFSTKSTISKMSGKTALVTGSTDSRSIGWNAAKLLATGNYGFTHILLSVCLPEHGFSLALTQVTG
jgi:hypothetical protein